MQIKNPLPTYSGCSKTRKKLHSRCSVMFRRQLTGVILAEVEDACRFKEIGIDGVYWMNLASASSRFVSSFGLLVEHVWHYRHIWSFRPQILSDLPSQRSSTGFMYHGYILMHACTNVLVCTCMFYRSVNTSRKFWIEIAVFTSTQIKDKMSAAPAWTRRQSEPHRQLILTYN